MTNYEQAAFESVERLKEKHLQEIQGIDQKVRAEYNVKFKWSKELMDLKKQEKIHFSVKDYQKAEECRRQGDRLEQ